MNLSPWKTQGRGECRVPAAPAVSCALCIGRTHTSNNEYTGTPGIPARNGFTAYVALSPVTGLFCHRRLRSKVLSLPGWANKTPQNLTPASGRQDHTILPSAKASLVSVLGNRSQVFQLALRSHRAQNAAASTASRPASVTIMIRPSCGVGWRELVEMICPTGEAKYFCKQGWTALSKNRPTGKSLEPLLLPVLSLLVSAIAAASH